MAITTPPFSRKRPFLTATDREDLLFPNLGFNTFSVESNSTDQTTRSESKKRRLSLSEHSYLTINGGINRKPDLPTPPKSPLGPTMRLRLKIPREELTKEDVRKLKIRRASAERWKAKLQRAFPKPKEIKDAYKLKLMRHYTNRFAPTAPNFIKPPIDRSPRVEKLLKQFPLLSSAASAPKIATTTPYAPPVPSTLAETAELEREKMLLKHNKSITKSEHARRLAWQCFSSREKDRVDRGREAMMQSGLWDDDLVKEGAGLPNELPEWRKAKTGIFAREKTTTAGTHKGYIST